MKNFIHNHRIKFTATLAIIISIIAFLELLLTKIFKFLNDFFIYSITISFIVALLLLIYGFIFEKETDKLKKVTLFIQKIITFLVIVPISIFLSITVKYIVGFNVLVVGNSMEPTLKDYDVVIVKFNHNFSHNSIIVADIDNENYQVSSEKLFIKRVIGMPGDKIKAKYVGMGIDELNIHQDILLYDLYIDDIFIGKHYETLSTPLALDDEDYIQFNVNNMVTTIIPDGYIYVLGDNRTRSTDSRIIGLINIKDVIGHVTHKEINIFKWEEIQ